MKRTLRENAGALPRGEISLPGHGQVPGRAGVRTMYNLLCHEETMFSLLITGLEAAVVDPTCHNPNTPPPAMPLVTGRTIQLPGHHAKVRRDGYLRR